LPRFDGTCTARWAADGEIRADRRIRRGDDSRETDAVTNVAKHFKWEPRGKRRIHAKPNTREIAACWLDAELAVIEPEGIVCLGATAAQALLGRQFRVSAQRGQWVKSALAPPVLATVHPSSILRAPDDVTRERELRRFVEDLRRAAAVRGAPRRGRGVTWGGVWGAQSGPPMGVSRV
jgi:uracil-DNA glycosylase